MEMHRVCGMPDVAATLLNQRYAAANRAFRFSIASWVRGTNISKPKSIVCF